MKTRKNKKSSDFLVRLGLKVREIRLSKGLSQEQLGYLSGLDRTYISSFERGHRNIGITNLKVIADSLNVEISDLFKE